MKTKLNNGLTNALLQNILSLQINVLLMKKTIVIQFCNQKLDQN